MQQPIYPIDNEHHELNNSTTRSFGDDLANSRRPTGKESESYKCCLTYLGRCEIFFSWFGTMCNCGPLKKIEQGTIGLKLEFGKFVEKLEPGLYSFNPLTEEIRVVEMRSQIVDVPNQVLLTKDNVTLNIDAFVNFRVIEPEFAIFRVDDYKKMIRYLTQATMKTLISENTLQELLSNRKQIEKKITEIIEKQTDYYGVHVDMIETQRIQLPHSMERAMATVAETQKQSEARIIDAKGNLQSAKIFREAADELSKNEISLQLQYFETLKYIAADKNSTIIVPDSILRSLKY